MNASSQPLHSVLTRLWSFFLLLPGLQAEAGEIVLDGRTFQIKEGFTAERVAGPPLVDRPITGDFDEQGALYLADSSGSNEPLTRQIVDLPHRIVKLIDDNGDGKFDRRTIFADRMMFPAGTLWYDGSLYVAAPPSIWKLTDTDGDGVADQRQEWFQGKTLTGCGNDLHGPYLGLDGWIYWTKGAFAEQTYVRPGRPPLVTRAAHLFRARPDGTDIEPVMTGGMDNPVDIAFSPGGERFFTTTFLQNPAGGLRDGIIHAIYGGLYGKPNSAIDGHPRTRPGFMPVMTHLGAAAPSGLLAYESTTFGPDYRGNLFATQFNMQKVSRHVLVPDGGTFHSRDEDLFSSPDHDFHPTDVIEDADGSLLVVDTGGWYKLCCPTSQLEKPDVLGAVFRIRKIGAPRYDDARGTQLAWTGQSPEELAVRLSDPRPAVRRRAVQSLAAMRDMALPSLRSILESNRDPLPRREAIWAATRIDGPEARMVARIGLKDTDETNRQAAIHSASVQRDRGAVADLLPLLNGASRSNARAAAEAVGRLGDPSVIPAILEALASNADPMVDHSLTFALVELAAPEPTRIGLTHDSMAVRLACTIALDQMLGSRLTADQVVPWLTAPEARTREVATWICSRYPEWGEAMAKLYRDRLADSKLSDADRIELEEQMSQLISAPALQSLLATTVGQAKGEDAGRISAVRIMGCFTLKTVPPDWAEALASAIGSGNFELARTAIETSRALVWGRAKPESLKRSLREFARNPDAPPLLRIRALAAVPGGLGMVHSQDFRLLLDHLDSNQPAEPRAAAADVLTQATLSAEQLQDLAKIIEKAGPQEVDRLPLAFEKTRDDALGLALVQALGRAQARASIRVGIIRPILDRFGPEVQTQASALYASLNVDEATQRDRLREWQTRAVGGDVRRGQVVFQGTKAGCSSCHAIGYLGGKVGPDLSKIGQIRGDRDLLEAILYPSASFVRSYEPVAVATVSGQVHNGIVASETTDAITLTLGADRQIRVPRDQVEEMRPGTISVMPAGLDQILTTQEMADLIAFLRSRR